MWIIALIFVGFFILWVIGLIAETNSIVKENSKKLDRILDLLQSGNYINNNKENSDTIDYNENNNIETQ